MLMLVNKKILSCFTVLVGFAAASGAETPGATDKPLNVLMILADDLGWSDTTLMGETTLYKTPNLERLAKRGMVFHQAYAASPLCSPTRASILTGQSPARTGITSPTAHIRKANPPLRPSVAPKSPPGNKASNLNSVGPLNTELPTLGGLIQKAGYATGHFGKWHLGHPPYSPLEHGFELDIPQWPGPGPARSFLAPWNYPKYDRGKPGEHIEDRMASEAAAWIKKQAASGKPFYAQYWQFSVHAPFDAKPEVVHKYAAKVSPPDEMNQGQHSPTYAAMVESLDDAVGTLLDALDEAGVSDHTLIVFYSDNGGNEYNVVFERDAAGKGFLARPTDNAPLRGGKATIFEGGIRVPAVIAWPRVVKAGAKSDARIQSTDLYPTILSALGIQIPEGHALDGIDLKDALTGRSIKRPGGMVTYFPHAPGVPDWLPPCASVHNGDWKLIRIFFDGEDGKHRHLLYNLQDDIGETTNLAAKHPDIVLKMDALIDRHLTETHAVVPTPNPAFMPDAYQPEIIGVQRFSGSKLLAASEMTARDRKEADALLKTMHPEVIGKAEAKAKPKATSQHDKSTSARTSDKPNIIVIFTDDHGYADLNCQGSLKGLKTPHLDKLAADGARCTSGYITAPQCIPSRAGLMAGRDQNRFGVDANGMIPMPLDEVLIPQRLQKAGYVTGMVGKWHLEPNHQQKEWIAKHMPGKAKAEKVRIPIQLQRPYYPDARGFTQSYFGYLNHYWATHDLKGNEVKPPKHVHETGYRLDIQTQAGLSFIERNHDQPFFLYLAYYAPHVPLDATEKYLQRFPEGMPRRRRIALAMLAAIDDGVGRIRRQLEKHELTEDTIIFFISDNGAPLKLHMQDLPGNGPGWDGSRNDPWLGEKGTLMEGGIRVPYLVSWPGRIPAGQTYDHPVSSLDVGATAVALAGLPKPESLEGVNLVPHLTGEEKGLPHDILCWRFWNQAAIRKGKWKYLQAGGERKYLFDLGSPEHERKNRIKDHPAIAKELQGLLADWAKELKAPGMPSGEVNGQEQRFYEHYLPNG